MKTRRPHIGSITALLLAAQVTQACQEAVIEDESVNVAPTPDFHDEFMVGINTWGTKVGPVEHLRALGVRWHAPFLRWSDVEAELWPRVDLTVADVRADEALIDSYLRSHDLGPFDRVIDQIEREGFVAFPVIGQGFTSTVPRRNGLPIVPHPPEVPLSFASNPQGQNLAPLAPESYLGHLYLHARAVVRRYRGRIDHWMIDPELNQSALFRLFGGWKAGDSWADWDFLTEVVRTLSAAIKDEQPDATVCLPFNTDQPPAVTFAYAHSLILSNGAVEVRDWPDAITEWLPYIDVVGVDFFESQGTTDTAPFARIRERIRTAVARAEGRPVVVTSIGAPSGPTVLGWTEQGQSSYLAGAFDAAVSAGARGFFLFEIATSEAPQVRADNFDVAAIEQARLLFNQAWDQTEDEFGESFGDFVLWMIDRFAERGDPDPLGSAIRYISGRLFDVLETAEAHWGLVRRGGTTKPAFDELARRYRAKTFTTELAVGTNLLHVPLMPLREDYRAKDLLDDTGATLLLHYDSATRRFVAVSSATDDAAPANVRIRGDEGYLLVSPTAHRTTFLGTAWPASVAIRDRELSVIGLPVRPDGPEPYFASDLLRDLGASTLIWHEPQTGRFRSYVAGASDTAIRGDQGFLVVGAPVGIVGFPGSAWGR